METAKRKMLNSVEGYTSTFVENHEEELKQQRILKAMEVVDRSFFTEAPGEAYIDAALPLENGQTISQPSTVARMLLLADLERNMDVLEVGSGSGWNASLIAYLVHPGKVVSIERIPELAVKARDKAENFREHLEEENALEAAKLEKLEFRAYNVFEMAENPSEKFDRIIITAGIERSEDYSICVMADGLLNDRGRLICPFAHGPIIIMDKQNGKIETRYTDEFYSFVPLLRS